MWMQHRRLLIPALVGIAGLVSAGIFWLAIQSSVRFTLWATVAEWQPTNPELRKLAECRAPGWWAWVKVLAKDRPVSCGEVWAAGALARRVTDKDRAQWLRDWVDSPDSSPLRKLRAALALSVAGQHPPEEPAWLSLHPELPSWPAPGLAAAVAHEEAWGVHLGPRWMALGQVWAMPEAGRPASGAVAPLEAVWTLGDEEAARSAASAVARGLGAPPDLPENVRYRRSRGLHAANLPPGWAEAVQSRPRCESPCLELWIDLLRIDAAAELRDHFNDPELEPALEPLGELLGYTGRRGRALAWWMDAAATWVRASPRPAHRLASLGLGATDGRADPVAVVWDRSGARWTSAAVLAEVGRRAGVDVSIRLDEKGALWATLTWSPVPDEGATDPPQSVVVSSPGCDGRVVETPQGTPLSMATIYAGALAEAATQAAERPQDARRLASAALRLDPVLTRGLVDRLASTAENDEQGVARGIVIGAALVGEAAHRVGSASNVDLRAALSETVGQACVAQGS